MKITKFKSIYKDYFPVGEGWRPLVEKLVDDIIEIDPTIEITQVKQKFGSLRFYYYGIEIGDKIFNLVEKACQLSSKICEQCGTKKEVTKAPIKGNYWVLTLCKKCRKKLDCQD